MDIITNLQIYEAKTEGKEGRNSPIIIVGDFSMSKMDRTRQKINKSIWTTQKKKQIVLTRKVFYPTTE